MGPSQPLKGPAELQQQQDTGSPERRLSILDFPGGGEATGRAGRTVEGPKDRGVRKGTGVAVKYRAAHTEQQEDR